MFALSFDLAGPRPFFSAANGKLRFLAGLKVFTKSIKRLPARFWLFPSQPPPPPARTALIAAPFVMPLTRQTNSCGPENILLFILHIRLMPRVFGLIMRCYQIMSYGWLYDGDTNKWKTWRNVAKRGEARRRRQFYDIPTTMDTNGRSFQLELFSICIGTSSK